MTAGHMTTAYAGYTLDARLGAGGMGEVFRAQRGPEPPVALKLLAANAGASATQRLLAEGDLLTRLTHPNVVRVREVGISEGRPYMAMELLTGSTVAELIEKLKIAGQKASHALITHLAQGIAQGLLAAHTAGVLHRDLKPSNVMLTEDNRVVVLDFGIAKSADTGRTKGGQVAGSPAYMAPEAAAGQDLDVRSDIYQFGLLMYELITLGRPYPELSALESMNKRLRLGVERVGAVAQGLDPALAATVDRCLKNEPNLRPASFAAVLEWLSGALTESPGPGPAPADSSGVTRERLGPYKIEQKLGQGGMGIVYRARKVGSTEDAALKVMFPEAAALPEVGARFRREIRVMRQVAHPNLVKVLDEGVDGDTLYFVMEHVSGYTLREVINQQGKVEPAEATRVLEQTVAGVGAIHAANLVHRDLKPANVMITDDGRVKVMDMGMARGDDLTPLTRTGELVGTPLYFPPEYIDFQVYDERSDLYQIGLIYHELLTGKRTFPKSDGERASSPLKSGGPVPAPPELKAFPHLIPVYQRLLSPSPGQRFQSAVEVLKAIRELDLSGRSRVRASGKVPAPVKTSAPVRAVPQETPSGVVRAARFLSGLATYLMIGFTLVVGIGFLLVLPSLFKRLGGP